MWDVMPEISDVPDGGVLVERGPSPFLSPNNTTDAYVRWHYKADPSGLTRGGITIFQHDYLSEAKRHYARRTDDPFGESVLITTPAFIPDNFNYQSTIADESLFGCQGQEDPAGFFPAGTLCEYYARYDEFVVVIHTMIDYKGITVLHVSELESLLEIIDDKFRTHLIDT